MKLRILHLHLAITVSLQNNYKSDLQFPRYMQIMCCIS